MEGGTETFPRCTDLWRGAILATLAHAIWLMPNPTLAYELSWDGPNYHRQDSQGTRGTITFYHDQVVGVFRDDASPRVPWHTSADDLPTRLLHGMPLDLQELAQRETLRYLFDEWQGSAQSIFTAAFWGDGERLTAAEPFADVVANGAHLVRIEMMEPDAAAEEWQAASEWSDAETDLLRTLYHRRMAAPGMLMVLKAEEYDQLVAHGRDGFRQVRELLAAIGITLPKHLRSR